MTKLKNKNILVITDYLTRWAEAIALPNQLARTYASAIIEHIILRHGAPKVLLSDNAKNFTGEIASEIYNLLKIRKIRSSAYRPQTNGLTERFNHTLITMLSHYVNENQSDWDIYLPYVMCAYRSATQETVKHSPFYLLYGREPRLPIDALLPIANNHNLFESPVEYVREVQRRMQHAHDAVNKKLNDIRQSRIDHNSTLYASKLIHFNIGDIVMKRIHQVKLGILKLAPKWKGFYKIIDKLANGIDYIIHPIDNHQQLQNRGKSETIHGSQIKFIPSQSNTNEENIAVSSPKSRSQPETSTANILHTVPILPQTSSITSSQPTTMSVALSSTDSDSAATHPDYREKLSNRMSKRDREKPIGGDRRSMRENKGQMVRDSRFVDPTYMDFDDDEEFKGRKNNYELDE